MEFHKLKKDVHLHGVDFCKAVHNTAFMSRREPQGIDADRVIPELLEMTYILSDCKQRYDYLSPHEIIEQMKKAHLRGLHRVFKYGTYNTDFIIKKAYETRDLELHILYCYNRIWEYINYLTNTSVAA